MKKICFMFICAFVLFSFTGCKGGAKQVATPDSPEELVKMANKAINDKDMNTLWQLAMPENYRKDIQGLVDEFKKVDAELYNKAMGLVPKLIALLEKDESALEGAPVEMAHIKSWVKILEDAGLFTHSGLQKFNVDKFIAKNGKDMYDISKKLGEIGGATDEFAMLEKMTITLKESEGDKATLLVKAEDEEEEVVLIKDGKTWVIEELQKEWPKAMKEAKEGIAKAMSEIDGEKKAEVMMMLTMIEAGLESGDLKSLMGGMMGGM